MAKKPKEIIGTVNHYHASEGVKGAKKNTKKVIMNISIIYIIVSPKAFNP